MRLKDYGYSLSCGYKTPTTKAISFSSPVSFKYLVESSDYQRPIFLRWHYMVEFSFHRNDDASISYYKSRTWWKERGAKEERLYFENESDIRDEIIKLAAKLKQSGLSPL